MPMDGIIARNAAHPQITCVYATCVFVGMEISRSAALITRSSSATRSADIRGNSFSRGIGMSHAEKSGLVKNGFVWIDLEMTGLNPDTDRIIEIATIVTDSDLND